MRFEIWLAFVLAATVILIIPGPTIMFVITQAISHGRRSVLPLAGGVVLGDFTAMTLSLLGLGAILATSASLFTALKLIGAAYLIYLGVKVWRTDPEPTGMEAEAVDPNAFWQKAFLVTTLNPKSIAFFVAFLPQFVDAQQPAFGQLLILGTTFLVLAWLNAALYALFADQLRERMRERRVRRWFNRFGGAALIGGGVLTAVAKR